MRLSADEGEMIEHIVLMMTGDFRHRLFAGDRHRAGGGHRASHGSHFPRPLLVFGHSRCDFASPPWIYDVLGAFGYHRFVLLRSQHARRREVSSPAPQLESACEG
jgi:hypothetical protein